MSEMRSLDTADSYPPIIEGSLIEMRPQIKGDADSVVSGMVTQIYYANDTKRAKVWVGLGSMREDLDVAFSELSPCAKQKQRFLLATLKGKLSDVRLPPSNTAKLITEAEKRLSQG
ncbi:hypothetical protein HY969_02840 [Candidatus Kaiserbacteria bacterium]|nr:hypothetical protein [Candidatus Kaiserbacteria bacterium]